MLSHLKVLEIANDLGAYTGKILAELGAQVIKIEPPAGDPARGEGATESLSWVVGNTGKLGARLDLDQPADVAQFLILCRQADVLIQGGGDELAVKGLDYDRISADNPGLISVIIAPFAEAGPMAGEPASELTLMAMSGIVNMVGSPDQPPLTLPGRQAYGLAGIQGVTAALTALRDRATSGLGQRVWVSAFQSAVLAGYRDPIVWEWTGRVGVRTGNRLVRGKSGVRQVWQVRDGYVTWSLVDNPPMVRGVVALMKADGSAGTLADVEWENVLLADAPQEQINAWEAELETWFLTRGADELAALSAEQGLGLSRIDTPAQAVASPQWQARGFWRRLKDEGRGLDIPVPGPLFASSQAEPHDPAPAPSLTAPSVTAFAIKEA